MAENSVKTVQVDLPAELFDVQSNVPLMHQVVVAQLAAHPPALPPLAAPQPGVARPLVAYQPPVALKVPAAHSRKRTD